jgi:hypothetical protein
MARKRKASDEVTEKATTWFGLITAAAGLLAQIQKFDFASINAICVLMFCYLFIYLLHDIYGLWFNKRHYSWYVFRVLPLLGLTAWFCAYWLQRTLGPVHPKPRIDVWQAYSVIFPAAVLVFIYCCLDLYWAYHTEYEGYRDTIQAAIVSMVVVVVLGFMSYPA